MNSSTVIHFKPILVSVSVLVGFINLTWPLKRWVDWVDIKYVRKLLDDATGCHAPGLLFYNINNREKPLEKKSIVQL